jgi:hypothetical protein
MSVVLCLVLCRNQIMGLLTSMRSTGGTLTDGDVGLAQMYLPRGWKRVTLPGETTAAIQAADRLRRRFVLVQSDSREDFVSDMALSTFGTITFGQLTGSRPVLEVVGPRPRTVGGFAAEQRETVLALDRVLVKYRHTVIAGDRALHQVVAWSTPSAYDSNLFDRVLDGFRERPGTRPVVRDVSFIEPPSDYQVH